MRVGRENYRLKVSKCPLNHSLMKFLDIYYITYWGIILFYFYLYRVYEIAEARSLSRESFKSLLFSLVHNFC